MVFLFSGLNSYAIILAGLASNSRYSLIGGVRAIAQLISYEIPLSVSILTLFCIQGSYNLYSFAASKLIFAAILFPTVMIFFVSLLAETNRTPYDLPEAEAELVEAARRQAGKRHASEVLVTDALAREADD